ncbi:MAG: hypothetical protein O7157_00130 [Wolbachia endosymbiont of Tetragnatha montana]|nr:hypothetical protein [Wolbachia endosymbiont of Tetragnatha montana]
MSTIRTETTNHELDFLLNTKVALSNIGDARSYSRVIPEKIQSYGIICGPTDQNIQVAFSKREITRERKKWSLDTYPNDCNNAVVYNDKGSNKHRSLCYMESQSVEILTYENSNITVVFGGNNILVNSAERNEDVSHNTENRYHFSQSLKNCTVHKPGDNFFYITGNEFSCNLKREGQKNIVVTQGNFTDSENIHSIVGNNGTNHIEVSYAGYVDGQGGNDVITAKNSPVIKGYFGDNIYGKGVTVLPIALRDISKMILEGNRNTIYSKDGNLTIHGKEMLMKTRDGFFVTATKIDSRTKMVTDLHVVNYNGTEVLEVYDDSIQKLILYFLNGLAFGEDFKNVGSHFMHKLFNGTHLHKNASGSVFADNPPLIIELALEGKFPSNPNFKTTRQMFSKKLDVVIGDYGHHVFYADRQSHFFTGKELKMYLIFTFLMIKTLL